MGSAALNEFWVPMLSWLVQIQQGALALAVSPSGQVAGFLFSGLAGAAFAEVGLPISGKARRLSAPATAQGLRTVLVVKFARCVA